MSKKRTETKLQLAARIAKAANTRRARTLAAKAAVGRMVHGTYVPAAYSTKDAIQEIMEARQPVAIREQLLNDAKALTMGSRNKSYGDPFINFMLTARLKELFWDAMEASGKAAQQNSPFGHSIDMVLTNLARIATSPSTHLERDRYLDGANYIAIAYEVGVRGEK